MWVLPSRGRPHNLARFAQAYYRTGASTPVWLRLDSDDPAHPEGPWTVHIGPRVPLSQVYAEAFERFPDAPWYGFIADDVVPETPFWDVKLIEAAGTDGMAVPSGGHDPGGSPHFVLGGDLVREVGWLALPGLDRLYIDTVWADINRARSTLRMVPEVVLRHYHFSNSLALMDVTYRKSPESKKRDRSIYERWLGGAQKKTSRKNAAVEKEQS